MEFFEKAFDWLADISAGLPQIKFKAYFIVVLAVLFGIGVIFAFTYLGSHSAKLTRASKKIQKYLDDVDFVNDDNVSDFTEQCFSQRAPQPLRDSWVQYLGVRFGYPSDIVSDKNVYDKIVKKNKDYRSTIYLIVSLIVLGVFAFWGFGTLDATSMSVIHFLGLVLIAVVYLVLNIIHRKQSKSCLEKFYNMQEDLDAKVNLQVEKNFATDSSPLFDLVGMVEEIVARNSSKDVEVEEADIIEPTPIETLIELEKQSESLLEQMPKREGEEVESVESAAAEQEIPLEEVQPQAVVADIEQTQEDSQENIQESVQENVEDAQEEPCQEEVEDAQIDVTDEVEEYKEDIELEPIAETSFGDGVQEDDDNVADAYQEYRLEEVEQQEDNEEYIEEIAQDEQADLFVDFAQEDDNVEDVEQENDMPEEIDETQEIEEYNEEESDSNDNIEESEDSSFEEDALEEDEEEIFKDESEDDVQDGEYASQDEPEVVYVVDGEEDEDDVVKPAKLVKLPNLVDYMLSKDMPKPMKIQIATMLISTYKKFENSKEDRKIVVSCLTKVMRNLQEN